MTALAAAQGALQRLVHRMVDAAPVAWRHDPLFRGASIGAGVALALFLLRVLGPHDPALDAPATTLRYAPGVEVQTIGQPIPGIPAAPVPPAEVPKIAPGHPLSDAAVAPTPNGDRFGTFTPGRHP